MTMQERRGHETKVTIIYADDETYSRPIITVRDSWCYFSRKFFISYFSFTALPAAEMIESNVLVSRTVIILVDSDMCRVWCMGTYRSPGRSSDTLLLLLYFLAPDVCCCCCIGAVAVSPWRSTTVSIMAIDVDARHNNRRIRKLCYYNRIICIYVNAYRWFLLYMCIYI